MISEYKILDTLWFTNVTVTRFTPYDDSCIGVVAVETYEPTGEWKAYIGMGAGVNKSTDEQQIARHGSGLLPQQAQGFFPNLDIEKYKKYRE
jgi:hypothetical protein